MQALMDVLNIVGLPIAILLVIGAGAMLLRKRQR
jgi:LPXTG-motif cell wall-anchored protein